MVPNPMKCATMLGKFLQEFTVYVNQGHRCIEHSEFGICTAEAQQLERLNIMKSELTDECGIKFMEGDVFISDNPIFTKLVRAKKRRSGRAEAEAEAPVREALPKVELPKV